MWIMHSQDMTEYFTLRSNSIIPFTFRLPLLRSGGASFLHIYSLVHICFIAGLMESPSLYEFDLGGCFRKCVLSLPHLFLLPTHFVSSLENPKSSHCLEIVSFCMKGANSQTSTQEGGGRGANAWGILWTTTKPQEKPAVLENLGARLLTQVLPQHDTVTSLRCGGEGWVRGYTQSCWFPWWWPPVYASFSLPCGCGTGARDKRHKNLWASLGKSVKPF